MSAFDDAFVRLMVHEGGYSDNPADPGGETMWGVTAAVARAHGYSGLMRELSLEQAKAIAKAEYWDAVRGDELPGPLAFQVFDAAYNSGVEAAAHWLQEALGMTARGPVGPQTMAAVAACDPLRTVLRFNAVRLKFLASLPAWPSFGRGWARRISSNLLTGAE